MVRQTIALNQLQHNPKINVNGNPVTVGVTPQNIYTVPAGKKAVLNSLFTRLVSLGTGTFIRFNIVSTVTSRLVNTTVPETVLTEKLVGTSGIEMNAGDDVQLIGDGAGDNSSVGFSLTVEEFPL